jgi:hypothetical protein
VREEADALEDEADAPPQAALRRRPSALHDLPRMAVVRTEAAERAVFPPKLARQFGLKIRR